MLHQFRTGSLNSVLISSTLQPVDRVRKSEGGGPLVALQLVQLLQLVSLNFFPFEKTICNREDLNFFYLRRKFKHGSQEKNRTGPTGATGATSATGATGATSATGATDATGSQEKKELAQLAQPAQPAQLAQLAQPIAVWSG